MYPWIYSIRVLNYLPVQLEYKEVTEEESIPSRAFPRPDPAGNIENFEEFAVVFYEKLNFNI